MADDLISVLDVAAETGKLKASIFKVLKKLAIEPQKLRSSQNRGQVIAYITQAEHERVLESLRSATRSRDFEASVEEEGTPGEVGVFYLVQLEPNHDPGRFKLGFAVNMSERLRALRCSAPFATVLRTWPCKRLWEKTAIESIATGSERVHTEVFRTQEMSGVVSKCEQFFDLMPKLR